jgi:hypothetical protein
MYVEFVSLTDIWENCPFLIDVANLRIVAVCVAQGDYRGGHYKISYRPEDRKKLVAIGRSIIKIGEDMTTNLDPGPNYDINSSYFRSVNYLGHSGPITWADEVIVVGRPPNDLGDPGDGRWYAFIAEFFSKVVPNSNGVQSNWAIINSQSIGASVVVIIGPGGGAGALYATRDQGKTIYKVAFTQTGMNFGLDANPLPSGGGGSTTDFWSNSAPVILGTLARSDIQLDDFRGPIASYNFGAGIGAGKSTTSFWFGVPGHWYSTIADYSPTRVAFASFDAKAFAVIAGWQGAVQAGANVGWYYGQVNAVYKMTNVNNATLQQLEDLGHGIAKNKAQAIIDKRPYTGLNLKRKLSEIFIPSEYEEFEDYIVAF